VPGRCRGGAGAGAIGLPGRGGGRRAEPVASLQCLSETLGSVKPLPAAGRNGADGRRPQPAGRVKTRPIESLSVIGPPA